MERALQASAFAAFLALVGVVGVQVVTGAGQEPLEVIRSVADYQELLLRRPAALRAVFAFDHLFIASYTAFFAFLAAYLRGMGKPLAIVGTAFGAMLATGFLDMFENVHILAMLSAAEQGTPPAPSQIFFQMLESTTKFQVSYVGLMLFGLVFPRETLLEKVTVVALVLVQLPIGVLIHTAPSIAEPLQWVRLGFFVVAFLGSAKLFGDRRRRAMA